MDQIVYLWELESNNENQKQTLLFVGTKTENGIHNGE